jgi:hypothetical protein
VLYPILVPLLAIDRHTLHEVTTAFVIKPIGRDTKCVVTVDSDVDVVKPGRADEEDWLRDYWIETQHLPHKPRVHGTSVRVSWDAVSRIVETVNDCQQEYVGRCTDFACLFK